MVTWQEARRLICEAVESRSKATETESVVLEDALGRVLAEDIFADRPYPPFPRSARDGYALCGAALSGECAKQSLNLVGEVRAGQSFGRALRPGECVAIMTGAPVPEGADAVAMREFAHLDGHMVTLSRNINPGENIVPRSAEVQEGQLLLSPGARLGYAELALAAQVGKTLLRVHVLPRLAILSTGDEVVPYDQAPGPFQIRNSNSVSLAQLAILAGAEPVALGNASDDHATLYEAIEHGLAEDALVLTGGVSMGKYDLVEAVLAELGAEFVFDAVAIRPGRPGGFLDIARESPCLACRVTPLCHGDF